MRALFRALALLLVVGGCSQNYRAENHTEANAQVAALGFIQMKDMSKLGSNDPILTFGLPLGDQTNVSLTKNTCDSSAGSVLPPLAFGQCTAGIFLAPLRAVENAAGDAAGRTIALRGLEKYWVRQGDDYLCWAAAYETVRAYMHLQKVAFTEMPSLVSQECPRLARIMQPFNLF